MRQIDRLQWSWGAIPRAPQQRRVGLFRLRGGSACEWSVVQGENEPVVIFSTNPRIELAFVQVKELDQDDTLLNSLTRVIGHRFLELDCVKAVYFNFDEEQTVINVWTILYGASDVNRRKVYVKELGLIDEFPSLVFNFRTADTLGEQIPASSDYRRLTK